MNEKRAVLLLPGLDGTGHLFRWLAAKIEEVAKPIIVSYPSDRFLAFDELTEYVRRRVPAIPFIIVAESFSGPVAATVAAMAPAEFRGLLLSTSFVSHPAPSWLAALPLELFLRIATPDTLLSHLLLNVAPIDPIAVEVVAAVRGVSPSVLAARVRQAIEVDASDALRRCSAPMAYLAATNDRILGGRGIASIRRVSPAIECVNIKGPHLLLQGSSEHAAAVIGGYAEKWLAS